MILLLQVYSSDSVHPTLSNCTHWYGRWGGACTNDSLEIAYHSLLSRAFGGERSGQQMQAERHLCTYLRGNNKVLMIIAQKSRCACMYVWKERETHRQRMIKEPLKMITAVVSGCMNLMMRSWLALCALVVVTCSFTSITWYDRFMIP